MQGPSTTNLFQRLRVELDRRWQQVRTDSEKGVLAFAPSHIEDVSHVLFSSLAVGGFCTLPVTGNKSWNPRSHYYETVRAAARRGRAIKRAFLLPNSFCRRDPSLAEHVALDKAAGIQTSVLFVGDLLSNLELPSFDSLDFGLWDDQLLCVSINGTAGTSSTSQEWRVTKRREDLQLARSLISVLTSRAPIIDLDSVDDLSKQHLDLQEPLVTTAPIANFLSTFACRGSYLSPEDCSWYHSIWQYLRVLNMVSTPTWHSTFYRDALSHCATNKNATRVLISGTADYSTLAHVLWAYRIEATQAPEVTVLDLCETPLTLCRWYSRLVGVQIHTVAADVLGYQPTESYDLIVTDAFLTRFPSAERQQVIAKWSYLLRAGGAVVTTIRIDPTAPSGPVQATPQQAEAFRSRAHREARRWQDFLGRNPDDIAFMAHRYAQRMVSFPVRSEEEIRQFFSEASLQVRECTLAEVPGEMTSTIYAEVVAEKL